MNCSSCGHENPPASRFCLECGASLGIQCAGCGAELPAAAKFCNACGHPVASGASPAQLFSTLLGLFTFHVIRAEHSEARDLSQELLRLAEDSGEPALLVLAQCSGANSAYWRGELAHTRAHSEEAIALYAPERHRTHESLYAGMDPGVFALVYLGFALRALGFWDQSFARTQEALQLARQLSHPFSIALALWSVGLYHQSAGEPQRGLEQGEALIALATDHGFPPGWGPELS